MTYIALLGRIPAISLAELERTFGADSISPFSEDSALIETDGDGIDIQSLGGVIKAGQVILTIKAHSWLDVNKKIVQHYSDKWSRESGKQTLGISVYGWAVPPRDIQKTGLTLKSALKKSGRSVRLIPNTEPALNTATSHHNKLGLSPTKTELLVVKNSRGQCIIAESTGSQNISALAARDQGRPKRDAFVGMLPPKLALTMINLAVDNKTNQIAKRSDFTILDPFCGTGVVLQEAMLRGFTAYGTDLSEKMVDYSTQNLDWIKEKYHLDTTFTVTQGDAMDTTWKHTPGAIVAETYLGQPFSAPPRPEKLKEVRNLCNHIVSSFLENIGPQLKPGTPLCLAIPAWRDDKGYLTHLPVASGVSRYGFQTISLTHAKNEDLVYFRADQTVARQLLILEKK